MKMFERIIELISDNSSIKSASQIGFNCEMSGSWAERHMAFSKIIFSLILVENVSHC